MALFSVAIFTIFIIIVVKWFYNNVYLFNKRLRKFKSPPQLPVLGHALEFATIDSIALLRKYTQEHGDTVLIKIGPVRQILATTNYKFLEFLLTSSKILEKSMDYRNLRRWLGTGLLTSGGAKWKRNRKIYTPAFHYKILEYFIEIFQTNVEVLAKKFTDLQNSDSFNIYPLIKNCTLDIICETAMDTKLNAQLQDTKSSYVESVEEMCRIIVERAFSPRKALDILYYFTEDFQKEKAALKVLHDFTKAVIFARKNAKDQQKEEPKKKVFLDLLLDNPELTVEEIQEEVDTFMFAGHDTSASAISFALYSIANNPDVQKKIIDEQKVVLNNDFKRPITLDDLKEMKYLEMVIKESLRLYPSVPYYAREVTEDIVWEGETLPKGLTILLFAFGLHRNSEFFPDPEKFDPLRFDIGDSIKPFTYLPFSAGFRNCIGQKFAMLLMKTIISKIVQQFKLSPAHPKHELKLVAETVLISKTGICVKVERRQNQDLQ